MATLDELAAYLATQLSLTLSTDLFTNKMPETLDATGAVLAIYETGGAPSEFGFGVAGVQYEHPAIQVVARGVPDDFDTPRTLAENAYQALAEVQATTLVSSASSALYHLIRPLNPPQSIAPGPDEKRRVRWSFNVLVEKELSA